MANKAAQTDSKPAKIRELASKIRHDPTARGAIADALEVIADAMEPCTDCGAVEVADLGTLDMGPL